MKEIDEDFEKSWEDYIDRISRRFLLSYEKAKQFDKLFLSKNIPREFSIKSVKEIAHIFFNEGKLKESQIMIKMLQNKEK